MKNKLFEQLDKNKDGYITIKELQEADSSNSGVDLKNILMSIDMDKNGAINYSEFIAATMNDFITKDMKKVQAAFKFFDKDDNGTIEADDLKKLLESENDIAIDESVLNDIVKEWDYDGDGKIDYKEFYRAMSIRQTK
jgi:calcium-dependent protein kinase